MITKIGFTVYAVNDIKKARAFYEEKLGLVPGKEFDADKEGAAWVEYDIAGATFTLGCAPGQYDPSEDGAVISFEVDDFDKMIAGLKASDVPFKLEPMDFPTCKMAIVTDPDKNRVLIHKKK